MSRAPLSVLSFAALSLASAVAIAGCGSDGGTPQGTAAPDRRPARTHTPKPSPTRTATPAPAATPTATASRGAGRHKAGMLAPLARPAADAHLLAADRLPTVAGHDWRVGSDEQPGAVGACQKTELETIGAVETTGRRFTADDGLTAVQVVARFADAKSAWRAHEVLVAWRDDCEERVRNASVGPIEPVTVTTGTADGYRGSFRARAASLGILRKGAYLSLVEVAAGQETYPDGWDPARVAVRRVARTF